MSARILLVNPNTTVSMTEGMADAARAAARPGTEIDAATVEGSVPFIDGWYDETVAAAAVARLVSERAGTFDAAIVACFGDPGLYAARELTDALIAASGDLHFAVGVDPEWVADYAAKRDPARAAAHGSPSGHLAAATRRR